MARLLIFLHRDTLDWSAVQSKSHRLLQFSFLPSSLPAWPTFPPLTRREGRKIAGNGGILIEQLINPACHDGEIAANGPFLVDAIFYPWWRYLYSIKISCACPLPAHENLTIAHRLPWCWRSSRSRRRSCARRRGPSICRVCPATGTRRSYPSICASPAMPSINEYVIESFPSHRSWAESGIQM